MLLRLVLLLEWSIHFRKSGYEKCLNERFDLLFIVYSVYIWFWNLRGSVWNE